MDHYFKYGERKVENTAKMNSGFYATKKESKFCPFLIYY